MKNYIMSNPFTIIKPHTTQAPLILSLPHTGSQFPASIKNQYIDEKIQKPDDTDWDLDKLYDFAPALGVTTIIPHYSRWVIDLNRDISNHRLYDDGRLTTSLTPDCDFSGQAIYKSPQLIPDDKEIKRRLNAYYLPYHQRLSSLLEQHVERFGKVLLWDGHSIRHFLPLIHPQPFPDFILGNANYQSCCREYIDIALCELSKSNIQVAHNFPFQGGAITRKFGQPKKNIHALQLEMNKTLYMKDDETEYDSEKALRIKNILKTTFTALIEKLMQ